jgi:cold shock CspA family protein
MPRGNIQKIITNKDTDLYGLKKERKIFFHMSSLKGFDFYGLRQEVAVEFDVEKSPRVIRAVNVRNLNDVKGFESTCL